LQRSGSPAIEDPTQAKGHDLVGRFDVKSHGFYIYTKLGVDALGWLGR
jgi:hypothetical protein